MEVIKNILIIIGIFVFLSLGLMFLLKSGEAKKRLIKKYDEANRALNETNEQLDELLELMEEVNEPLEQVVGFIDRINNNLF